MKGNISNAKTIRDFISSIRVGEAESYKNLTVFPLYSDTAHNDGYKLLDEAISTNRFIVTEKSEGGTVPELMVINQLENNVLILDGELLVGAKQNRIVNTTIVIGSGKEVVIPVSCVEQGRWHYRSKMFSSGSSSLYSSLRMKKSRSVYERLRREKSYLSDQHEIWDDIKEKSARFRVSSETGNMNDLFESYDNDIRQYEERFKSHPDQVGFIAVIGNKIAGLDVFGIRTVAPKVYGKLLKGYIFDALDQTLTGKEGSQKESLSKEEIQTLHNEIGKFLKELKTAKKDVYKSVGEGEDVRFARKNTTGFALVNDNAVVHIAAFAGNK